MAWSEREPLTQCIIVTTRDSPLRAQIEQLVEAIQQRRGEGGGLTYSIAYLEEIFVETTTPADRDRYDSLIQQLLHTQLAVIDLCFNAASFYVLGIRQTLSNQRTIALAQDSSIPTFANARFTDPPRSYINVSSENWLSEALAQAEILDHLQLASYQNDLRDSGIFNVIALEEPFETSRLHTRQWQLHNSTAGQTKPVGPRICIWEHEIQAAKGFDVWVNSENVHMEMARFWDKSVSAQIRKLGAVRRGRLVDDRRKDALGLALAEMTGTKSSVEIGTVFVTPTDPASSLNCDIGDGNGVKYVAHLAAVKPSNKGYGFTSGGNIDKCMRSVLRELAKVRKRDKGAKLEAILFPLIGSGDGGAHPSFVAHQMVASLKRIIADEKSRNDLSEVTKIGLIAYQRSHLDYITRELDSYGFVSSALEGEADA